MLILVLNGYSVTFLRNERISIYLATYKLLRSVMAETQRSDIEFSSPHGFHHFGGMGSWRVIHCFLTRSATRKPT
jgi:hypothetical protein